MPTDNSLIEKLRKQIETLPSLPEVRKIGTVLQVADGVALVSGLSEVMMGEQVYFPKTHTYGLALNLGKRAVGVIILGNWEEISASDTAESTGKILRVPVGEALIGRVVNPLGEPLDGKGEIKTEIIKEQGDYLKEHLHKVADVAEKLQKKGWLGCSTLYTLEFYKEKITKKQAEQELKQLKVDTIINQTGGDLVCIYVAIGQKESKVARIVARLKDAGALNHTIVVSAGASNSAAILYLAPYAGCAMGEYFRDSGKDALIVYDDLSKHAVAYRQIALLLQRPPGREAFPGDVFYLHSRLLERAAKLNQANGGGSLTALPIIETQAGDVSAYIPTNVISITDGQIYLETDLFYADIRPAVNVGLSVSRVGSAAQTKAMKAVAKQLRLELAQFRELAAFAQFGSDLDADTRQKIERGKRLTEILKQTNFSPLSLAHEVIAIFITTTGLLDSIPVDQVKKFEESFRLFLETDANEILNTLNTTRELTEETRQKIAALAEEFKKSF